MLSLDIIIPGSGFKQLSIVFQIWNAETHVSAPDNYAAMEPFSVRLFLEAYGKDFYIPQFTSGGYVTLAKCAELTEQDVRSMGIPYSGSPYRSEYVKSGIYNYIKIHFK